MAWSDILDFAFKEVASSSKLNAILENIKVHNHKGTNQGVRIGQIAPATIPPPFQSSVNLTTSPVIVATLTIPASAREVTIMMEYFLTSSVGTAAVNFTFSGDITSGNIRRPGAASAATSDFWVKTVGPLGASATVNVLAAVASGTGTITPKVWAVN